MLIRRPAHFRHATPNQTEIKTMVKLTAPLLSLDARGQLGKSLIYAKHGQTNYAKAYNVPANPKSALQVAQRTIVSFITKQWALLSAPYQALWSELAALRSTTPYHAYLYYNLDRYRRGLLPVPKPTTIASRQVNALGTLAVDGGTPTYTLTINGDQDIKTAYVALITASITDGTPVSFTQAVTTANEIVFDDVYFTFTKLWTPAVAGAYNIAAIVGMEDGCFSEWIEPI